MKKIFILLHQFPLILHIHFIIVLRVIMIDILMIVHILFWNSLSLFFNHRVSVRQTLDLWFSLSLSFMKLRFVVKLWYKHESSDCFVCNHNGTCFLKTVTTNEGCLAFESELMTLSASKGILWCSLYETGKDYYTIFI